MILTAFPQAFCGNRAGRSVSNHMHTDLPCPPPLEIKASSGLGYPYFMDAPEYINRPLKEALRHKGNNILTLHECLFSLNIASALGYACLVYISTNQASTIPANDSTYYFLRSTFRANDLLHLPSTNPVSTDAVAREFASRWSQFGDELVILVTTFAVASIVLFLLRFSAGTSAYRLALSRFAGLTALFAAPVCYLCVSRLTGKWASEPFSMRHYTFWKSSPPIVFAAEILCLGILFAIYRKLRLSTRTSCAFLFVHYAYWVMVLWPEAWISTHRLYAPYLLVLAFPLSGIVWLRYLKSLDFSAVRTHHLGRARLGATATAIIATAVLLYLWLPNKGYHFAHPNDMKSLTIQMARGPCYGSCPSYTITIHANGLVEYVGVKHVRVQGSQKSAISQEQVIQLLQNLDRVHFSSLEDRAFAWCFDSGSVSVLVSVDGKTKRVVSDDWCTGSKSGLQAQFVKTAAQIDTMVGSGKWVSCDGPCWK